MVMEDFMEIDDVDLELSFSVEIGEGPDILTLFIITGLSEDLVPRSNGWGNEDFPRSSSKT